jgi:hypothetical protein
VKGKDKRGWKVYQIRKRVLSILLTLLPIGSISYLAVSVPVSVKSLVYKAAIFFLCPSIHKLVTLKKCTVWPDYGKYNM